MREVREMLGQLHSLPAMRGRGGAGDRGEAAVLQVVVTAHDGKDDEQGKHVEARLDASAPHVRHYVAEAGLSYNARIRNLGEQALTLTPVYYCIKAARAATGAGEGREEEEEEEEEEDRQEAITLQPGGEKEWFKVELDVAEKEKETGWKLEIGDGEGVGGALVLQLRFAPQGQ